MMMFWFLLVMLAAAWGIVGFMEEVVKKPPPAPVVRPAVKVETPQASVPVAASGDAGNQANPDGEPKPSDGAAPAEAIKPAN